MEEYNLTPAYLSGDGTTHIKIPTHTKNCRLSGTSEKTK
jgi:hypothetical protein